VPQPPADLLLQAVEPVEYADRLARVRTAMAARSLAALVVIDPANLYYLTGYNAWPFYTPQCLVAPAHGELQLFARAMDAAGGVLVTGTGVESLTDLGHELTIRK
jgi:ectoine hydrolase